MQNSANAASAESAGAAFSVCAAPPISRLKTRAQFVAASKAKYVSRGAVTVQGRDRKDGDPRIGVGFTATKKIGGAVVRNRAKRRLREAARHLVPLLGRPGWDYVLVARLGTPTREWGRLLDDVKNALISLAPDRGSHAAEPVPTGSNS
jgi:ribonuclease P protein component